MTVREILGIILAKDGVLSLPGAVVPHDAHVPAIGHVPHTVPLELYFLSFPGYP